jgi:hypothetical protein
VFVQCIGAASAHANSPYVNAFGDTQKVELPLTHKYYWMDRQGNVVGTNDLTADPIRVPPLNGDRCGGPGSI